MRSETPSPFTSPARSSAQQKAPGPPAEDEDPAASTVAERAHGEIGRAVAAHVPKGGYRAPESEPEAGISWRLDLGPLRAAPGVEHLAARTAEHEGPALPHDLHLGRGLEPLEAERHMHFHGIVVR